MVVYTETLEPGVVTTHTCNSRILEGEAGASLGRSRPTWTVVERVRQRETATLVSSRIDLVTETNLPHSALSLGRNVYRNILNYSELKYFCDFKDNNRGG